MSKTSHMQPNDASSLSRRSTCNGLSQPSDAEGRDVDPRIYSFMEIDQTSSPNKEDVVKQGEQYKSIWSILKNKLRPKKKEKGNFVSYVEPNSKQNYNQDQILLNPALHYKHNSHISQIVNYNFIRAQNKPFYKETKFRASTIDSRRLNSKNLSGQIFMKSKRAERFLLSEKNYQPHFHYLCDGTAERIDRWLADSEAFMKADQQSTVATAVVGSHRKAKRQTYHQDQTLKQNRKLEKQPVISTNNTKDECIHKIQKQNCKSQGLSSNKPKAISPIPTNLFRQSSRSVGHLPASRTKADTSSKNHKTRPLSQYECQDMPSKTNGDQMQLSVESNKVPCNSKTQTSFQDKSPTSANIVSIPTRETCKGFINNESSIKVEGTGTSSGLQQHSVDSRKCNVIKKVESMESINKKQLKHLPQSRSNSIKSKASAYSSESLNSCISCNESYCTDYTPHAFGEEFKRTFINSPNHDLFKSETPFSHKSEPNVYKIHSPGVQDLVFSKIPAENNVLMRKKLICENGIQHYQTPRVAKFVTTIYLTGDEYNLDDLQTNNSQGNIFDKQNKNINKIPSLRNHQPAEKINKTIFQIFSESQPTAAESHKVEMNAQDFQIMRKGNQILSNVQLISKTGMDIQPIVPSEVSENIEPNKSEDFHIDIDIFDYKMDTKGEGIGVVNIENHDKYKVIDKKNGELVENVVSTTLVESLNEGRIHSFKQIPKVSRIESPVNNKPKSSENEQTFENELFNMHTLPGRLTRSWRPQSVERMTQLSESSDEDDVVEDGQNESITDLTIFSLEDETHPNKVLHHRKSESDDGSLEVFHSDTPVFQVVPKEISQPIAKRLRSKVPEKERHSPPLNSFTSRSTLSFFEEMDDPLPEIVTHVEPSIVTSQYDLPIDEKRTDNIETQTHFFDDPTSTSNNIIQQDNKDITAAHENLDQFLDVNAFMTVKHNDHARIFDLCFGNSQALNGISELQETVENHHCKGTTSNHNSTQRQTKKGTHASNLQAFNPARAFYV